MSASPRTIVLLIRHAHTDGTDRCLAGRASKVSLDQSGRAQAERLRERSALLDVAAVYSSPLERAIETATPLALDRGLRVEPLFELIEIDFGEWTGARFDRLEPDQRWARFNRYRSMAPVPGGERAIDAQARIVSALDASRARHPNQTIVFVTHADVIRLAVLHILGAPLDFIHRMSVLPASITVVALAYEGATLLTLNDRDALTSVIQPGF